MICDNRFAAAQGEPQVGSQISFSTTRDGQTSKADVLCAPFAQPTWRNVCTCCMYATQSISVSAGSNRCLRLAACVMLLL